jgi:thymidylate kinase
MLIAIEGIDGVGKTTIGKAIANKLNYSFREKALQEVWDISFDRYISLQDALKATNNNEIMAMFFGLNNLLCGIDGISNNIVADRYIATNYFWYGTEKNECIYDALLSVSEKPVLTVILRASTETLQKRIEVKESKSRIVQELEKIKNNEEFVPKTKYFLERKGLDYIIVDNDSTSIEDVINIIISKLRLNPEFSYL